MIELKELILNFFKSNKKKYNYFSLKKKLSIKGEEKTKIFDNAIKELIEDGDLICNDKNEYMLFTNDTGFAYGKLQINNEGTGFIHTKDGYTIMMQNQYLYGALDGDSVIVNDIFINKSNQFEGKIKKILKRKSGKAIFEVVGNGKNANLIPYDKKNNIKINLNKNDMLKLYNGDIIITNVGLKDYNNIFDAELIEVLGNKYEPNTDIKVILTKYGVDFEFSKEALEEAKLIPTHISNEELNNRIDLRNKNIFTIDCDNTKDRDDSIGIEKLQDGNFKLYVNISHISHYIKKNSALFNEALKRNNSHYLNNYCIPMFPNVISNGICSLDENVDRLTKTCEMIIDESGNVLSYNIYDSIINSKKAMKYSEVNKVLKNEYVDGYMEFIPDLIIMNELSIILEKRKKERKYLDFDIEEINIIQDEKGLTNGFTKIQNGYAEKIIENFMLITNNTIAEEYSWIPFIFRIHEMPNENMLKQTLILLKESGITIKNLSSINKHNLDYVLDIIKKQDRQGIFRNCLLKAMKKARYDTKNYGHYALKLDKYCHFTSPIRRIADFINHTIIDEINNGTFDYSNIKNIEKRLSEISKNASLSERIELNMETEAKLMAFAEYMEKHIGEKYTAYITNIEKNSIDVKTTNHVTGKVKLQDILDDKYYCDYNKKILIGKSSKRKFKIGDKVCVIVKSSSKENRIVNFKIPKQKVLKQL